MATTPDLQQNINRESIGDALVGAAIAIEKHGRRNSSSDPTAMQIAFHQNLRHKHFNILHGLYEDGVLTNAETLRSKNKVSYLHFVS